MLANLEKHSWPNEKGFFRFWPVGCWFAVCGPGGRTPLRHTSAAWPRLGQTHTPSPTCSSQHLSQSSVWALPLHPLRPDSLDINTSLPETFSLSLFPFLALPVGGPHTLWLAQHFSVLRITGLWPCLSVPPQPSSLSACTLFHSSLYSLYPRRGPKMLVETNLQTTQKRTLSYDSPNTRQWEEHLIMSKLSHHLIWKEKEIKYRTLD